MKRIIKFRAFDKKEKRMFEVAEYMPPSAPAFVGAVRDNRLSINYSLNEINIMQFTGLKDKNGEEIYEGDILKINGLVEYSYGGGGGPEYGCLHIGYQFDECNPPEKDEIIGNIYQNEQP